MNPMNERSADGGQHANPEPARLRLVGPAGDAATGGPEQWWHSYRMPLLLLLSGPAVLALVVLDAPAWVRVGPVFTYLALVPGLACVRLLGLADRALAVLVGIGLSLALAILVAQMMIYLHAWSTTLGLATLVLIASGSGLVELYRGQLPGPPGSAPHDSAPHDSGPRDSGPWGNDPWSGHPRGDAS